MSDHQPRDPGKLQRQKRLEEQLRENLKRRRQQAKARRTDADGTSPDEGAGAEPEEGLDGMS